MVWSSYFVGDINVVSRAHLGLLIAPLLLMTVGMLSRGSVDAMRAGRPIDPSDLRHIMINPLVDWASALNLRERRDSFEDMDILALDWAVRVALNEAKDEILAGS